VPLRSDNEVDAESGLGGKLGTLGLLFGGSGKAPMLVVLRIVLPGVGTPYEGVPDRGDDGRSGVVMVVFKVGTAGVDRVFVGFGVGRPEVVTERVTGFEAGVSIAGEADVSGMPDDAFLVFGIGNAGKGRDGGASGEVEGRLIPIVVIVAVADADMASCSSPSAYQQLPCTLFVFLMGARSTITCASVQLRAEMLN